MEENCNNFDPLALWSNQAKVPMCPPRPQRQRKKKNPRRQKPSRVSKRKKRLGARKKSSQLRKSCPSQCERVGPVTTNPFLNFLRQFRKTYCCRKPQDYVKKGERLWHCMSPKCKARYIRSAKRKWIIESSKHNIPGTSPGCPESRPNPLEIWSSKSNSHSVSCSYPQPQESRQNLPRQRIKKETKTRSISRKRSSCKLARMGPVTRNPFFNFLRQFRKTYCFLMPQEYVRRGARVWNRMSPQCKTRYIKSARKKQKVGPRRRKAKALKKIRKDSKC